MRKLTLGILVTAMALGNTSCKKDLIGEGPVTSQTRNVQDFTGIDLRMNGNVYYTKGAAIKVEVSAPQSIHSMLETNVTGNQLVIRYSNGKTYDADDNIRIYVTAPDLNSFVLNTSGSIYCLSDINPGNLYLRSSGSGDLSFRNIVANNIEASTVMSGRISATGGMATNEKLRTYGSGKIDLSGVLAKTVVTHTEGSGDMRVNASDRLDVTIKGSGSVYFSGNPQLSTHISGSGRLVRL